MPPQLIEDGMIQILGQTANSVVYAVEDDSKTGRAKDSLSVLKGGTVWYRGREALGPGKSAEESDEMVRKEAEIYKALGKHDRILSFLALEIANIDEGIEPKAWALRLERAPHGHLRDCIMSNQGNPPDGQTRLEIAIQFVEGVAHIHQRNVIWGDLSTRNALLFDDYRVKLGDFADSDMLDKYFDDWYGCEVRYCQPGSGKPNNHIVGTMNREIFALGTAIYEITEWKVPYSPQIEVSEDEVIAALVDGKLPEIASGNPAEAVIRCCWQYKYKSSQQALDDLQKLRGNLMGYNISGVQSLKLLLINGLERMKGFFPWNVATPATPAIPVT
ncbi:TKL protein kinase [Helicocarpus griseus UAMH5409]|uniref:TKL protein kinase n=1 Tax=Helicocarpus griseus UAMH5409 TaxID=1447875 RepID=A0A2B7XP35_9EURO|nr:TKL protein kinase [Helicocarpus griseus UAMH5409]